jgi:hypothetical protein
MDRAGAIAWVSGLGSWRGSRGEKLYEELWPPYLVNFILN